MASLTVESFFTSILLNESINDYVSDIYNKNLYNGKLTERDLFKLLKTANTKSYFIFNYTFFIKKLIEWNRVRL